MPVEQLPSDLIPLKTAAKLLRCHLATCYRMVTTGRLRGWWRAGTRYMVSEADVRALFQPVQPMPEIETSQEIRRRVEEAREQLRRFGVKC